MLLQRLMRSSVAVVAALWTFAAAADEGGLVHPRTGVERSPATAGDVPLTGDLDGNLLVLDARNGKEVSRFNTGGPIARGIVTYQKGGKQYAAVASGYSGGSIPLRGGATVLIFGL